MSIHVPDDPREARRVRAALWRQNDHRLLDVTWTESVWLTNVIGREGLATLLGWEAVHFRPAKTKHGWRTPVQGSLGTGWPDLILCRPPRMMAVELKSDAGKLEPEQERVLAVLAACGMEVHVWRPSDLEEAARVLR